MLLRTTRTWIQWNKLTKIFLSKQIKLKPHFVQWDPEPNQDKTATDLNPKFVSHLSLPKSRQKPSCTMAWKIPYNRKVDVQSLLLRII